ncbi:MAG: glycerate kinase [Haliea sp.]|nr:MAG: glycerate kinase [Haliea sp.]
MNWQRVAFPIIGAVFVALAWRSFGWPGVAAAAGGIVMWALLHFTRLMHILKRAAESPVGHVSSAVMLNARLKPNVTLMHVVAMTKALGEQLSAKDVQPEVFRWTDTGGSHVTCEFAGGKLMKWALWRPPVEEPEAAAPTP